MRFGPRRSIISYDGGFTPSDIPQSEADALISFYNDTDGDNWTDNTGWLTDPVVGNWFGVTVAGGHVTRVNLVNNNLNGSGTTFQIGDLQSLERFLVYINASWSSDISGWSLPASLEVIYVYNTSVSGDISGWTLPASLTDFYIYSTSVSGNISGWSLPASLDDFRINNTSVSGDISGWTLPASLVYFRIYTTSVSGDISGWSLPASLQEFRIYSTSVSNAPDVSGATNLRIYYYQDCGLSQAHVDAVCQSIYTNRAVFTYATPSLNVGGTNAAPSGTYQDGDPPTTGLEYIYEIANDPETEGFNTWSVTWNGGSAP